MTGESCEDLLTDYDAPSLFVDGSEFELAAPTATSGADGDASIATVDKTDSATQISKSTTEESESLFYKYQLDESYSGAEQLLAQSQDSVAQPRSVEESLQDFRVKELIDNAVLSTKDEVSPEFNQQRVQDVSESFEDFLMDSALNRD